MHPLGDVLTNKRIARPLQKLRFCNNSSVGQVRIALLAFANRAGHSSVGRVRPAAEGLAQAGKDYKIEDFVRPIRFGASHPTRALVCKTGEAGEAAGR